MADFYSNKLSQLRQQRGGADEPAVPVTTADTWLQGAWAGWGWAIIGIIFAILLLILITVTSFQLSTVKSKFIEFSGKMKPSMDLTNRMKDFFTAPPPPRA